MSLPRISFPWGLHSRRKALLACARENEAFILEDDYDIEYRFRESPLPALQGISPAAPVIYTGSYSKLLFPSLRLGYVVLPRHCSRHFAQPSCSLILRAHRFTSWVLADFLEEGHLESHLRRMRSHYDSRRTFLIETLHQHFGESVTISGDEAGMYLLATFCTHLSEDEAWQRAFAAGVRPERIYWPCGVSRTPSGFARFVIAYASLTEEEIDGAWSGKYPLTIDRQSEYGFTVPDSVVIISSKGRRHLYPVCIGRSIRSFHRS